MVYAKPSFLTPIPLGCDEFFKLTVLEGFDVSVNMDEVGALHVFAIHTLSCIVHAIGLMKRVRTRPIVKTFSRQ